MRSRLELTTDVSLFGKIIKLQDHRESAVVDLLIEVLQDKQSPHLNILAKNMMDFSFFSEIKIKEATAVEVVRRMELLRHSQDDEVIRYGSEGDKFYIVLSGVTEVQVPNPLTKREFTEAG